MKNETKFYELLKKAKKDEVSLILVVNKIMPLINKYSINEKKEIDEDLQSCLIEEAIKIIKYKNIAEKLL